MLTYRTIACRHEDLLNVDIIYRKENNLLVGGRKIGTKFLFFPARTSSAVMGFPSKSISISRGASQDSICSVDVISFVSGVIIMFYSPLIDQEEMKALR